MEIRLLRRTDASSATADGLLVLLDETEVTYARLLAGAIKPHELIAGTTDEFGVVPQS